MIMVLVNRTVKNLLQFFRQHKIKIFMKSTLKIQKRRKAKLEKMLKKYDQKYGTELYQAYKKRGTDTTTQGVNA